MERIKENDLEPNLLKVMKRKSPGAEEMYGVYRIQNTVSAHTIFIAITRKHYQRDY
jgi:hypothetical protein